MAETAQPHRRRCIRPEIMENPARGVSLLKSPFLTNLRYILYLNLFKKGERSF